MNGRVPSKLAALRGSLVLHVGPGHLGCMYALALGLCQMRFASRLGFYEHLQQGSGFIVSGVELSAWV